MEALTKAVLPDRVRGLLEGRLPEWIEPHWWTSEEELLAKAPLAEIGWFDLHAKSSPMEAIRLARDLRWLNTDYTGVDWMPLDDLAQRGVVLTNGSGLTSIAVAEFAVMTMLAVAKDYRAVVRAQDRHEWLRAAPGTRELAGSRALVLGGGAIGKAVARMLAGFDVSVDSVRSRDGDGWRERVGDYDWIVLALPGTPQTRGLVDAECIAAMKPDAVLVNFARADVVDQDALTRALAEHRIAGAVLDLTDPEPLPPDHPLWSLDNCHITMHLSGIPTPASAARAAERFLANCALWRAGEEMEAVVDLRRGY